MPRANEGAQQNSKLAHAGHPGPGLGTALHPPTLRGPEGHPNCGSKAMTTEGKRVSPTPRAPAQPTSAGL